jgi:CrcB protein
MFNTLAVGLGGFIGAMSRYLFSIVVNRWNNSHFPIATLLINVLGSFLIGLLTQLLISICPDNKRLQLFLTTGILGGFTTFSTFSIETVNLFQDGNTVLAIVNILSSIGFCLIGVLLGKYIAKMVVGVL